MYSDREKAEYFYRETLILTSKNQKLQKWIEEIEGGLQDNEKDEIQNSAKVSKEKLQIFAQPAFKTKLHFNKGKLNK